jgi:hypothetical protein
MFISCEKDSFVVPQNEGLKDKLARIYIFYQDNYIGYHNYVYDEDNGNELIEINTYNSSDIIKKRISYSYNIYGLIKTRLLEDFSNNTTNEYEYTYTFFDSIESYIINNNSEKFTFQYNTSRILERQNHYYDNQLSDYTKFYYDTSDKIWLVRNFSKLDSIIFYDEYKYYVDNSCKIFHYDDKSYLGYELLQYNAHNKLSMHYFRDAENYISKLIQYDYYQNNQLKTKEEITSGETNVYRYEYIYYQ